MKKVCWSLQTCADLCASSPRHIEAMIIRHIKHLTEEQKLTHGSIHTHCFSIFHFFEMNDILLNTRKVMRFLPPNEGTREDRAYTQQEIQELLLKTDDRSRAMNGRWSESTYATIKIYNTQYRQLKPNCNRFERKYPYRWALAHAQV